MLGLLSVLMAASPSPVVYHQPAPTLLEQRVDVAADRFHVPAKLVLAIAFEASHFNPDAQSAWEGWGMFDLREGDQDPSLEHGAALLSENPNRVATDWELSIDAAAAILADQARLSNGGVLPDSQDLLAWWNAVRAFSGRQEPELQDLYTSYIFETIAEGYRIPTRWGVVAQPPVPLDLSTHLMVPPPTATDTSLAYQFYAACTDNYSDYSRGAGDIDMMVIHTVQGSYSGCYSWFANCSAQASAHYVVRSSDGQITQMVKEQDVAWHAGHWDTNTRSIGIEHEGYVDDPSYYTDAMYQASAALTADVAARQGIPLDRSHIIGHDEVPGCSSGSGGGAGCHTDPGIYWDWDYYMALVTGSGSVTTGDLTGVIADSDIYNGTRLAGATVWIQETSQTTIADGSGNYTFQDLPFGTYTVHATYPGYVEGSCGPKATSNATDWCSIALFPDNTEPHDSTPVTDSEPDQQDDSSPIDPPTDDLPHGIHLPGTPTAMRDLGGCAVVTSPIWLGLASIALLRRRKY